MGRRCNRRSTRRGSEATICLRVEGGNYDVSEQEQWVRRKCKASMGRQVKGIYERGSDRGAYQRLAGRVVRVGYGQWRSLEFYHQHAFYSLGPSTFTPLDEPTLLMSRPSSASSLLRSSASFLAFSSELSSGDPPINSGFLSAILKASAMIAASAPENRPDSCAELLREMREPSSPVVFSWVPDAPPAASPAASPVADPFAPSKGDAS